MLNIENIKNKLVDEEDGLYSYTHKSIDFFTYENEQIDFFIRNKNGVSEVQIQKIKFILKNCHKIEEAVLGKFEEMLDKHYGKANEHEDIEDVYLGNVLITNSPDAQFVLIFELLWDDHGFGVLMNDLTIKDFGGEYDDHIQ